MRASRYTAAVAAGLARQTLRARLTALLVTLLLVGCAAAGIATSVALHSFLLQRLDQQLSQAGSRYATALEHDDRDADNANPATSTVGQPVGTLGARLLNGSVTSVGVISATSDPVPLVAADRAVLAGLTPSRRNRTVTLPALGRYRIEVAAGRDGDVLVTGLPLRSLEETLHHAELAEAIVFLAVVAGIGVIGGLAVRWSLRPLERVAATALRVSELPLATGDGRLPERVPPAHPRTEVGQVSTAVNHMLERVEDGLLERRRSEDRLRRFVADASHELRTPLAVVRSHSELIQRSVDDVPEEVLQSLQRIESETTRMSRLVDDLLLLARLDSGQPLRREPVDLTLLAIDTVTDARVAGPEHRWSLDLPDEPVIVTGDDHRLQQVLVNLLANVRAHTPEGTNVTVAVTPSGQDVVEVSVTDNGPGIPPTLLPRVRERFVRGDGARSRSQGSSGLGLAIVTSVVAAHHGSIDITSEPGNTRVTIRLPASESESVAAS